MQFPFKFLSQADFDVVGFGTNAVDHLITLNEYPSFDSKVELNKYSKQAGGEAASTLVGIQRLGLQTAYAGRFGGDEEGRLGMQSLADEGVDTSFAEVIPDAATQVAFIMIDEQSGERTIIWHRDKKLTYHPSEAPLAAASKGKILHLSPHDTHAAIEMAKAAKEHGAIVSIDIDNIFDGIGDLLPLIDVFIASSSFPAMLTGCADDRAALRAIAARYGCGVIGMTRGRKGSLFLCEGRFIETTAFDVPGGCKDTTGAGDAFRAGLLYGLLTDESIERSALIANAVAALKCRKIGARASLPNKEELDAVLKNL